MCFFKNIQEVIQIMIQKPNFIWPKTGRAKRQ
jgi:hypothetical protein